MHFNGKIRGVRTSVYAGKVYCIILYTYYSIVQNNYAPPIGQKKDFLHPVLFIGGIVKKSTIDKKGKVYRFLEGFISSIPLQTEGEGFCQLQNFFKKVNVLES